MTRRPKVVVIILNWNGRALTLKCLETVAACPYDPIEVLVVDNGSDDGSIGAIREAFPQVAVLELDENLGYARGNNAGLAWALQRNPDWILFLNNDTEVAPDLLEQLIKGTEVFPDGGLFGPKVFYADRRQVIWYAGGEVNLLLGRLRHRGIREQDNGQYDEPCRTDFVSGCCMLIRAEAAQTLGGFDPAYAMYVEDADLCYRARERYGNCYYLPDGKVWHAVSSSLGGVLSGRKVWLKFASSMRFFWRYAPWWYWPSILMYQLLYYGVLGPGKYGRQRWQWKQK